MFVSAFVLPAAQQVSEPPLLALVALVALVALELPLALVALVPFGVLASLSLVIPAIFRPP
jgi:hypothetical protein